MVLSERIRSLDWVAALTTLLLVLLGLAMLFSTTSEGSLFSGVLVRQVASLAVALAAYGTLSLLPYHQLKRYAPYLYGAGLIVLFVLSQIGRVIRGTMSRFEIIGIQLQPSELMKVALILVLAWFFARQEENVSRTAVMISGLIAALAVLPIVLEPDVGMAALLSLLWLAMVVFLGTSWRIIALLGVVGIAGSLSAWQWLLADFQRSRILTFLNPASDPLGAGYNVVQSIVALGSGSWWGQGLGHGPQSQLKFLPEQHTDFILASLGEELGFLGILLVVVLYSILLWRIIRLARITRDPFGRTIAVGTYLVLLISFFISAGMNMGLLPVTGIPLPLISYGGSNLVTTFILLGIVQSVYIHNRWMREAPSELIHL
jgi:rod shape determining protein RodA